MTYNLEKFQLTGKIFADSLYRNIGMIPQHPSLFHSCDDEVIEAAKRAHAHEFNSK